MASAEEAVGSTMSAAEREAGRIVAGREFAEPFDRAGVLTVSAGHTAHDIYTAFLRPLLPTFIASLALSNTKAGLLTVFLSWSSLFQPFLGHLSDRFNLNQLFVLAPAVTGVMMSLTGVAPTYGVLVVLLLVVRVSSASLHSVGPAVVGKLAGQRLGRSMGLWMVGGELARTIGPLVAVTAVSVLTLEKMPWLMIMGVVTSLLLHSQLKGISEKATEVTEGRHWREVLGDMGPLLVPILGITFAQVFAMESLTTYLPILLTDQGSDLWFAGLSLSIFQFAGVGGALVGGAISDGLGRRLVLICSFVTPLLMFVFITVRGWARFPLLLMLGFTALSVTPVVMAVMQERFPENRALATGIFMALSAVIRALAVVVLGGIGDFFTTQISFLVSAGVAFVGLPFVLLVPTKGVGGKVAQVD